MFFVFEKTVIGWDEILSDNLQVKTSCKHTKFYRTQSCCHFRFKCPMEHLNQRGEEYLQRQKNLNLLF